MKNKRFSNLTFYKVILTMTLLSTSLTIYAQNNIRTKGDVALKLYIFDCGTIESRDLSMFSPLIAKDTKKIMANPCYLIVHPKGSMFWDTGISDDIASHDKGIEVAGGAFKISVSKTLSNQLKQIPFDPTELDYLAFSHMHWDHTGNTKLFPNAKWLIQKEEQKMAESDAAEKYGYQPLDYKDVIQKNLINLSGDHDVFDDGSVLIISTPGHSMGHQSLLINLPKTGSVLLSGDLYHFQENRDNYGIPIWNDKKTTIRSFALIDQILDSTKATFWIQHDKIQFDQLKHSPSFYD